MGGDPHTSCWRLQKEILIHIFDGFCDVNSCSAMNSQNKKLCRDDFIYDGFRGKLLCAATKTLSRTCSAKICSSVKNYTKWDVEEKKIHS